MARTRSIKPEFKDDEKLAKLSRDSRLAYVIMWGLCDDYGVCKAHPGWLRNHTFPYDDITVDEFKTWLQELESIRRLLPFEANGEHYYYLPKFLTHQRIDHPSKTRNPEPPKDILKRKSRKAREVIPNDSRNNRSETETEVKLKLTSRNSPSPDACELTQLLKTLILKNKPDRKLSANWQSKAEDQIDKMIRLDKRLSFRIKAVIEWCQSDIEPRGNGNFCWAPNILSGAKLRKQFDRLEEDMKRSEESGSGRGW